MISSRKRSARLRSVSPREVTPSPDRRPNFQSAARRAHKMGLKVPGDSPSSTALAVDRRRRGSLSVTGQKIPVENTPGGSVHRFKEPAPPLCLDVLERVEAMDLDEEEAEEVMAANPEHMRRWVQPFLDPQLTSESHPECSLAQSASAVGSTATSGNNICGANITDCHNPTVDCRPSTSGITTSIPKVRTVNDGSDFDSDFDDEFDEAISFTERQRDIPDDDELDVADVSAINAVGAAMDDAADGLIGEMSDFLWQEDFTKFSGMPETFSGNTPGPVKDFDTPYDAFIEIWGKGIIEHITKETNRYAKQTIDGLIANNALKPCSRLHQWEPTDADEIIVLFAVFMYMGIDPRGAQREFWYGKDYLQLQRWKDIMSYNRYILLKKFLHFSDNTGESTVADTDNGEILSAKLAKIRPLILHLNTKFSTLYHLDRNICIDESLTLFKGRLSWIQAIKSKAARVGIKSYELCESRTGYLYRFQIYTGKSATRSVTPPGVELGYKSNTIVLDLLKGLERRGHCVTMDNFYNCPSLARYLKTLGFDCLGTLRTNRRHVPNGIANIPKNVAKGTMVARHCGDVSIVAWKDSKLVTMISTYHGKDTYLGSRAGRILVKPVSVRDYNSTMGGVDLKDQKLSMYLLERKRGLKWYIKIFLKLMNVSIHNAFIMYVSSQKRRNKLLMTHREFRYSLVKALTVRHCVRVPAVSQPIGTLMRLRRDITHVPKWDHGRNNRKRCVICYRQGVSKQVHSQCVTCGVFLCCDPCWSEWHSLAELKGKEPRSRKSHIDE